MTNFCRRYRLTLFILSAYLFSISFFSCTVLNADSSSAFLSFRFSGEFLKNTEGSSRSLSASESENIFLEISLSGSYEETKSSRISGNTTITFSEIPVDSLIKAEAKIYRLETEEKTLLYTGESELIRVKEGENTLILKMSKYEEAVIPEESTAIGISELPSLEGNYYLTQDIIISSTWTPPAGEVTLDLNGFGIRLTGSGSVINVVSGSNLTINDSMPDRLHTVTLSGYRGIDVSEESGTTSVDTNGTGTVFIRGGYITGGNYNDDRGGAMKINQNALVKMTGGCIVGNTAGWGGGVFVTGGSYETDVDNTKFTMSGTTQIIYNMENESHGWGDGSGLYLENYCTAEVAGGLISSNKNSDENRGGLCVYNRGKLIVSGGRIRDHALGLKVVGTPMAVEFSGSPVVSDNTVNMRIYSPNLITITGPLTEGASIGVSMDIPGVFTNKPVSDYNDASKFFSDNDSYSVTTNSEGQLQLSL